MTSAELTTQIKTTASAERATGTRITINHHIPYVAIDRENGDDYFFQGDEADTLIFQANESIENNLLDVTLEDFLLWQSCGW